MRTLPSYTTTPVAIPILLASILAATSALAGDPATPPRVSPELRAAVAGGARPAVIVVFDVPEMRDRRSPMRRGSPAMAGRIESARRRWLARVPSADVAVERSFRHVNAVAARLSPAGLARLEADPDVLHIGLDLGGAGHLAEAIPLAEVDTAQARGFAGLGVTVAVLDSGYDSDHPDLAGDLVGEACFCNRSGSAGCCPGGGKTAFGPGSAEDDHGHGTNVTSIITGGGQVARVGGAPGTSIVAVKVLDNNNLFSTTSDVIAGLDWVIQNRPDVDIVNMSLGTTLTYAGDCDAAVPALASAIDTLRSNGVVVFASSGNDDEETRMAAPACVSDTISVGAVWDSAQGPWTSMKCSEVSTQPDQIACFSNFSATTDLFAPGARTTASGIGGGVSTFTGTSQASPLAAACAALLLEGQPSLSPDEIEALLEASPTLVSDPPSPLSFPRLDCRHALDMGVPVPLLAPLASGLLAVALAGACRRGMRELRADGVANRTGPAPAPPAR